MGWAPVDYSYQANHAHDNDVDSGDLFRYVIIPLVIVLIWFLLLRLCWSMSQSVTPQPRYESIPEPNTRGQVSQSKIV
eukprot:2161741-Rhodomonas_salina.3